MVEYFFVSSSWNCSIEVVGILPAWTALTPHFMIGQFYAYPFKVHSLVSLPSSYADEPWAALLNVEYLSTRLGLYFAASLSYSCSRNLLSSVGWIHHRLCEQYRYRQWIRESNTIIIVPDPPPSFSLSIARSAYFPASWEKDWSSNFSSVWAVNILCRAVSHCHWGTRCCYLYWSVML